MKSIDRAMRAAAPAAIVASEIRSRLERRTKRPDRARHLPLALGSAMAVTLIVALALPTRNTPSSSSVETERIKGPSAHMRGFRKTQYGSEALASGDAARAGDLIRLGYESATKRFGAIVSVDGRGHVTRHWPLQGATAGPLEAGGLILLDQAFKLDDAPRFERFHLVTADRAFVIEGILPLLLQADAVSGGTRTVGLPASFEIETLELRKEPLR